MNAISNIISVDPARKTLGALHPQKAGRFFREKVIRPTASLPHGKLWLNFSFASATPAAPRYAAAMLTLRLCFAAMLAVGGAFLLSGELPAPYPGVSVRAAGLLQVIAGVMLAGGLLSRYAMMATAIYFATMATIGVEAGRFDAGAVSSFIGSLTFILLGSGRYSLDYVIRKSLIRRAVRRRRRPSAATLQLVTEYGREALFNDE